MRFEEFEQIMSSKGYSTLAEISRILDSTPQAVSNWKSRDQVPHHIVNKIIENNESSQLNNPSFVYPSANLNEDALSFSDIMVTMAEQLKIILFIPLVAAFISFTYIQFIQQPKYVSWSTVLIPMQAGQSSGLAGIASQFGVNMNQSQNTDLSSPLLLPEIIASRTFAEKLLKKTFFSDKFDKELPLINILTNERNEISKINTQAFATSLSRLSRIIDFNQELTTGISIVEVTTDNPKFSRDLATAVLNELEESNRFYKTQTAFEKTEFIENRIKSVKNELEISEKNLKSFNEKNRQISSPALQLQQDRLNREVEVQKGIYLTLKQQLELAKIEAIQKSSILQVLDRPQIPLGPSNKNVKLGVAIALFLGLIFSITIAFFRSYLNNSDVSERKKIRRVRSYIKKKTRDMILDKRISLVVSLLMLSASPLYFGHKSSNPIFFGRYSSKLLVINLVYLFIMLTFIFIYMKPSKDKIAKNEYS